MAEFLLEHGADPRRRDAEGASALLVAEQQGNGRLLARLRGEAVMS